MDMRHLVWIGVLVGSTVGGWLPTLWGAGFLSFSSIIFSTIGGLVGIYLGAKLASW